MAERTAVEVWTSAAGSPVRVARRAAQLEQEGWDGMGVVDSQNLSADPYVSLAVAAQATSRLRLATAVTNPVTRHPAATATAAASVQSVSGGRMVLGIGRGDSSLAHLGAAPAPVRTFERYLDVLQRYLRQEDVPFDDVMRTLPGIPTADTLGMAGAPAASRIRWLRDEDHPKIPVDVAASGPRVIAAGARFADAITFAVGVDPQRLRWALDVARTARHSANLDPDALGLGTYVPVCVHPDREQARTLLSGGVASYARFSVMHGSVSGPVDDARRGTLEAVHSAYDMRRHFTHGSPQSQVLTNDTIDAFGIAGPSSYCVDRLLELVEAGLTRLYIMGPGRGADPSEALAAHGRFVEDVIPALHRSP